MAIKVSGTEVVSDSRQLNNINGIDTTTKDTLESFLDLLTERVGSISGAATLDLSTGNVFDYTPTEENTTFVFSNPPAAGTAQGFTLKITGSAFSVNYDIANASYDLVSFDPSSQGNAPFGIAFNSDGTKMYILDYDNDDVYQYSLSTGFDLSTASYDSVSFSVPQDTVPSDIAFNSDGTKMYILGFGGDDVHQYSLSTGFDLSTASYDNISFSVSSQDSGPLGIAFSSDGAKMYIVGAQNDSVYQYTASLPPVPATFAYPATVQWPGGSAPDAPGDGETDVLTFYTQDGGTTYYGFEAGSAMA